MKYKKSLEKIMNVIMAHRDLVDNLAVLYKTEIANHEKELENMKGTYTSEYISEYAKKWMAKGNYANAIKASSEKTLAEVTHYSERIKRELDSYFDTMVRPDFANQINALISTGMPLRDKEFKRLAENAQSYMELRLVKNFAESRTEKVNKDILNEDGSVTKQEVDAKRPYRIDIPDIDEVYASYDNFVAMSKQFSLCYAGANCELKMFLDKSISEYSVLATMSYFKNRSDETFAQTMEKANSVLPENKIKKTLSEADRKFIDAVINPEYPWLAEENIKRIVKNGSDSELVELLKLDERYSKYIDELEDEE